MIAVAVCRFRTLCVVAARVARRAASPTQCDLAAALVGGRHRDAIGERAVIGQTERRLRLGQTLRVRAELGPNPVQR